MESRPDAVHLTVLLRYQPPQEHVVQRMVNAVRLVDAWPLTHGMLIDLVKEVGRATVADDGHQGIEHEAQLIGAVPLSQAPAEDWGYECDVQPDYDDPVTKLIEERERAKEAAAKARTDAVVEYAIGDRVQDGIREVVGYIAAHLAQDADALIKAAHGLDADDRLMQHYQADALRSAAMVISGIYGPRGWRSPIETVTKVPSGPYLPPLDPPLEEQIKAAGEGPISLPEEPRHRGGLGGRWRNRG